MRDLLIGMLRSEAEGQKFCYSCLCLSNGSHLRKSLEAPDAVDVTNGLAILDRFAFVFARSVQNDSCMLIR